MNDHDERVRKRVLEIWEEEGRPEGGEYSRWLRARAEIRAAESETPTRAERPADVAGLGFSVIQPA